jgi:hypothetical protein
MPIPKEAVPGGKGNMKIVSMKESTAFVKTIIKEFPKAKRLPLYSVWKKAEKIVTFVFFIVSMYFAIHYFQMYRQDAMPFFNIIYANPYGRTILAITGFTAIKIEIFKPFANHIIQ